MIESFLLAIGEISNVYSLTLIFLGVVFGIIGGAIPGFTVTMAILVVFPFTFTMTPVNGISLMMGVFVGGYSGGIISAVMLGIPGTPSSITTIYDGYPMSRNGEPGRALGIGILSSFFGTLVSIVVLVTLGPLIAKFSMNFRPWEITALIIFALTLVSSLSNGAILKGLMAAAIGLFITTVGFDRSNTLRFDFGFTTLSSGFEILPVMIGVFAFTQLLSNIGSSRSNTNIAPVIKRLPYAQVASDVFKQKINLIRSSLIGAFVGALPGTGGEISNFISYDQAKKLSKESDKFGQGYPGGIVASEASNSAVVGGSLIPTLALGIPGDLTMAIMMGVLILHGISPGPMMFEQNPILLGSIYASLMIGAVLMLICQLFLIKWFAKIAAIPQAILIPTVLALCAVGTYALNNNIFDIWVLLIFGIFGYFLFKMNVPLSPLILGIVLGENFEHQLYRALELDPNWHTFLTRPLSATFLILAAASVLFAYLQSRKTRLMAQASL